MIEQHFPSFIERLDRIKKAIEEDNTEQFPYYSQDLKNLINPYEFDAGGTHILRMGHEIIDKALKGPSLHRHSEYQAGRHIIEGFLNDIIKSREEWGKAA